MKKILLLALVALVLVGCSKNTEVEINPEKLFKEEIAKVFDVASMVDKPMLTDINSESVVEIINKVMESEGLKRLSASYGVQSQGIGNGDNGNMIFCNKLPVTLSFDGGEEGIKKLVEELCNIPSRISITRFDIIKSDDEFHVDAVVNFLGDLETMSLSSKNAVSFQKNSIEINEKSQIELRDFDMNLTIRPSNSDSSAITLGLKNNANCLYSDENMRHNITVGFYDKDGKTYTEYKIGDDSPKVESFKASGDIKFDILSCERLLSEDSIDIDLTINNSSKNKVDVVIYNDLDSRVNIIKSGNVSVTNK